MFTQRSAECTKLQSKYLHRSPTYFRAQRGLKKCDSSAGVCFKSFQLLKLEQLSTETGLTASYISAVKGKKQSLEKILFMEK